MKRLLILLAAVWMTGCASTHLGSTGYGAYGGANSGSNDGQMRSLLHPMPGDLYFGA